MVFLYLGKISFIFVVFGGAPFGSIFGALAPMSLWEYDLVHCDQHLVKLKPKLKYNLQTCICWGLTLLDSTQMPWQQYFQGRTSEGQCPPQRFLMAAQLQVVMYVTSIYKIHICFTLVPMQSVSTYMILNRDETSISDCHVEMMQYG